MHNRLVGSVTIRFLRIAPTLCLPLFVTAWSQAALAQSAKDKAWTVLQHGLAAKHADERATAVRVLALLPNDPRAIDLAGKALDDEKPAVRAAAAEAFGQLKARSSIPKLHSMLGDKDVSVVMAAAEALIEYHDVLAYDVYFTVLTGERKTQQGVVKEQMKTLKDPKKLAQVSFEQGIGFVPFAGGALAAIRMIRKDDASPVRAAAARVLVDDPDPRTTGALLKAASDKSWTVRAAALEALARRGNPSVIPDMEPKIADEKYAVRYTAAAAVLRLLRLAETRKR